MSDPEMKKSEESGVPTLEIAASECFWSVIHAPQWRRSGALPESLSDEALADMPVALDEVFAVATPGDGGELVVCACRREVLARVSSDVRSLTPDAVPAELGVKCAARELNFLVGEYEPRSLRARRWTLRWTAVAALAIVAGHMTYGVLRRGEHAAAARAEIDAATAALVASAGLPDEAAAESELGRLRAQEAAAGTVRRPVDAVPGLARVLAAWPADIASRPLSITVGESAASVSVAVDGDPSAFLRAFRAPAGWSLEQPRVNSSGEVTRIGLQLKAVQEPGT